MAIGFNSIQLVADFIFKKVFCRKKESAFFSCINEDGCKTAWWNCNTGV